MKYNSTTHVKGDDIIQIVEAACALKTLGLKEINNEVKSFATEIAENLYELAYSLMYEHEYSCCGCYDDEENNTSPQNVLGNKTMADDDLIIHLSEKDSKIAGSKKMGLSYNEYPSIKPESSGLYLTKVNAEINTHFLYYFSDRDEWVRPYDDWMPMSNSNVTGWLKIY
ncbi:MAG: hypothetical protein J6T10_27900 [Methanobrevibacter sp.]|nr:hypothetical protein [Methanobrevibacter sp.]